MLARLRHVSRRSIAERRLATTLKRALRLLALALGLQLSSVGALAAEVLAGDHPCGACCDDCPLDREGRECPPGCIACHCAHGGATGNALARQFEEPVPLHVDGGQAIDPNTVAATGARAANGDGVYRPPRS
jgi:hypothetical protein